MIQLTDATILYLDDEKTNLSNAQYAFEMEGFEIEITGSIEEAKKKALNKELDIFICDLRLDQITKKETGKTILRYIRERNKDIFLALYTAYQEDLSKDELKILEESGIKIYDKTSTDVFMLNLQNDFYKFMSDRNQVTQGDEGDVLAEIKKDVIHHLKNVSNQDLNVPIPGIQQITIKDLTEEVINDSEIGKKYMKEWYKTLTLVQQLRKIK